MTQFTNPAFNRAAMFVKPQPFTGPMPVNLPPPLPMPAVRPRVESKSSVVTVGQLHTDLTHMPTMKAQHAALFHFFKATKIKPRVTGSK